MAYTIAQLEQIANSIKETIRPATYSFTTQQMQDYCDALDAMVLSVKAHQPVKFSYSGNSNNDYYFNELVNLLSKNELPDDSDVELLQLFKNTFLKNKFINAVMSATAPFITRTNDITIFKKAAQKIIDAGFTHSDIIGAIEYYPFFNPHYNDYTILFKAASQYILDLMPDFYEKLVNILRNKNQNGIQLSLVPLFAEKTNLDLFPLITNGNRTRQPADDPTLVDLNGLRLVGQYSYKKHKKQIDENLSKRFTDPNKDMLSVEYFSILKTLSEQDSKEYSDKLLALSVLFLNAQMKGEYLYDNSYYYQRNNSEPWQSYLPFERKPRTFQSTLAIEAVVKYASNAIAFLTEYFSKIPASTLHAASIDIIGTHLKASALPLLAPVFSNMKSIQSEEYSALLRLFGKYDTQDVYLDTIWKSSKEKTRHVQQALSSLIAGKGDAILPKIEVSLKDKSSAVRQTMALALGKLKTPKALQILNNFIHNEKDDEARDLMLATIGDSAYQNFSDAQLDELIELADARGKLSKPVTVWIHEETLPELKDKNGKKISLKWIQFLLYRMSRTSDIRTDMEARIVLEKIDRASASEFAMELYKRFIANGGEAKAKYMLTIAGLLADDSWVEKAKSEIPQWVDNNRGKMAEYGVKALALQGSTKALRAVEFFSRKYKVKYKNVGEAALQALEAAAEELHMDINELADSIIPDFGFENTYKSFEVNGLEYRGFIGKDFKIQYLNEDGKIMKSPPKGTDKETLAEFKDIAKEIRDVVKSQSSRMELYLVIQRRWEKEKWMDFFLVKPIMLVYAASLLWGEFDKKGNRLQTFYVTEMGELLNMEDEEIELEDDNLIGMLHPLMMTEEELTQWNEKFYELEITPIFPQLKRRVEALPDNQKKDTIIKEFDKKELDVNVLKSFMKAHNWAVWEVGDGGGVWSIYKPFDALGIHAFMETGGEFAMGWYEPGLKAELGELKFIPISDKRNEAGIPLEKVSAIVHSEVLSELRSLFVDNKIEQ